MESKRPETASEALREVVEWFYVLDSIAQKFALKAGRDYSPDRQIQIDMRQLAEWFEANPEADRAAWSQVLAYKPPTARDLLGLFAEDGAPPGRRA
jgi:hypothetical protein